MAGDKWTGSLLNQVICRIIYWFSGLSYFFIILYHSFATSRGSHWWMGCLDLCSDHGWYVRECSRHLIMKTGVFFYKRSFTFFTIFVFWMAHLHWIYKQCNYIPYSHRKGDEFLKEPSSNNFLPIFFSNLHVLRITVFLFSERCPNSFRIFQFSQKCLPLKLFSLKFQAVGFFWVHRTHTGLSCSLMWKWIIIKNKTNTLIPAMNVR